MNTLLVTTEFPPFKGGIANYYGGLANSWPSGETLSVMSNNNGELIAPGRFWPWRRAFKAIKERIKKDKIKYILVGQVLPLGTVVRVLSLFQSFKYAVFFHGMDLSYSRRRRHKKILTSLIIRRADKIICANNYVKAQLDKYYPGAGAKAAVVNPGISPEILKVEEETLTRLKTKYILKPVGGLILFTLGRLVKRKGVDKVIAALRDLPPELLDGLRYFVAGAGPDEEYLKALIPAELKDKIIFLGELTEEEKWAWLNLGDIFIMPARDIDGDYEGFGIVYLEANLGGKPVIAGRAGGTEDAVIDNYNGLIVDPEDENSIGNAIIRLAADKKLRDQLGQQGRARALDKFNWPVLAAGLSRQIQGILK